MKPTSPIYTRPRFKSLNGYGESPESKCTIAHTPSLEKNTSTTMGMSTRLLLTPLPLPPLPLQSARRIRGSSILVLKWLVKGQKINLL